MVMLLRVSWDISKPCLEEILETHSEKLIEEEIINISKNFPEIKEIHNIYYRKMGKNVIINLHMLVKSDTNILNAHNIAKKLKQEIIKNNESVIEVSIHIEPKE
jgi:divalent metal cation (Fe/Co/Zn/Cd) transporter